MIMVKQFFSKLFLLVIIITINIPAKSQVTKEEFDILNEKVEVLKRENDLLKSNTKMQLQNTNEELKGYAPLFMLLFLYGTVSALWAQSTGRHAIAWFFSGLIFSVFNALTILYINGKEIGNKE